MKHLEVRQKYSAARRIFNSLLSVSSGDETLHLMFDILLAKLESDYETILSPTGWLTCDIIQQAQVFLQEENSSIEGFQRPTLGPARNFNVVSGEFVQILHTGSDHWVCVVL